MYPPNAPPRTTRTMRSAMSRKSAAAAFALLLAGCTVGPDYRPPAPASLVIPDRYAPPVTAAPSPSETPAEPADLATWWERFDDPLLTDLIGRATAGNLRIAQSLARLAEAREALVQARGDQLPALTGSTGASRHFTRGGSSTIVVGGGNGSGGTIVTAGGSS